MSPSAYPTLIPTTSPTITPSIVPSNEPSMSPSSTTQTMLPSSTTTTTTTATTSTTTPISGYKCRETNIFRKLKMQHVLHFIVIISGSLDLQCPARDTICASDVNVISSHPTTDDCGGKSYN